MSTALLSWRLRSTRTTRMPLAAVVGAVIATATSGCSSSPAEPSSAAPVHAQEETAASTPAATAPGAARTLAKIDDWRADLLIPPDMSSALEVAYDADAAQRMWEDNVPAVLPAREGDPTQPGRYGDLVGVDFTDQVVALWSSGESGSCPGWASGVHRTGTGAVVIDQAVDSGGGPVASDGSYTCTSDRRSYRTLVVIDRSDLPTASSISATTATTGGADLSPVYLAAYPST